MSHIMHHGVTSVTGPFNLSLLRRWPISKQLLTSGSFSGSAHVRWNSASGVGLDATQMQFVISYSAEELRTCRCAHDRRVPPEARSEHAHRFPMQDGGGPNRSLIQSGRGMLAWLGSNMLIVDCSYVES